MARERDPNRDLAFEMYREHNGEILIKDIADKLGKGEGTVRGWKTKDEWDFLLFGTKRNGTERNAPKPKERSNNTERNGTETSKSTVNKKKKKSSGTKGSKKKKEREWNRNPKNQFQKRNQIGLKHGLYAKYMNAEQLAIIEEFETMDISDHLWYQIQCSFSAIVRAQRIMWVSDNADHTREIKKDGVNGREFEIAFSHEKYDSFVKAQSKAMGDYRTLVKKFLELSHEEDERRLKLEAMALGIEKAKLEVKKLEEGNERDDNTLKIEFVKREGNVPKDEWSVPMDVPNEEGEDDEL